MNSQSFTKIIGGNGPKMVDLEQMREVHLLQDRVELRTCISQFSTPEPRLLARQTHVAHLSRGDRTQEPLTEAFGSSIIEAASTGLFIVSTKVGGVPG
jgi:phosphatidylinositol glycan class A protein